MRHAQFPLGSGRHFGPMHHLELLNHPDLYDQMRQWFSASLPVGAGVDPRSQHSSRRDEHQGETSTSRETSAKEDECP
jgi:hypothetical protein